MGSPARPREPENRVRPAGAGSEMARGHEKFGRLVSPTAAASYSASDSAAVSDIMVRMSLPRPCWFALLGLVSFAIAAESPVSRTVIRRQGDDGVHTYRIPGLATTPTGTLIAVFDLRHASSGDLPGDIDVGTMRSTDAGKTWSQMRTILDFDKNVPGARGNGVGDPCVLVDHETHTIFVAALWSKGERGWAGSGPGLSPDETGQLAIVKSTDDGLTWSAPINLTAQVKDPRWRLCFNRPGAGIQLRDGTLVMPAQFRAADTTPNSCFT
ncbi:MAG: exo-alpha-sialidase [Opitutus sp.]|nr:exo-alpha-sialidase [Opitutus sp.]